MEASRFDAITRTFAGRRASRRSTLRGGAAGLAAALGTATLGAAAQDATPAPEATPGAEGDQTFFLFVQTFRAGTMVAKEGEDGAYILTLTGGPAQTIYFSDRPERIVGTMPTHQFLETLGFPPDNPPNAALVAQTDEGEDIVVVELLNPVYTEGFGPDQGATLTYDVRVLADYADEGLAHLAQRRADDAPPDTFGPASLFIDECPPVTKCTHGSFCGDIPGGPVGQCWEWGANIGCHPCNGSQSAVEEACNSAYAECAGMCHLAYFC